MSCFDRFDHRRCLVRVQSSLWPFDRYQVDFRLKISLDNSYARVLEANQEEKDWIYSYLCYTDPSRYWGAPSIPGVKDPTKVHLVDRRGWKFPAGLVPMVRKAALKEVQEALAHGEDQYASKLRPVEIVDNRSAPCEWDWNADLEWLHDYQFRAVWLAYEATRGIIKSPTGSGKGEMIWGLIKALPCHWLLLVKEKALMHELAARWEERTGETSGVVGDGIFRPDPSSRVTFCTFATLSHGLGRKRPQIIKLLTDAEGIIVDECHTLPAKSLRKVAMACRNAYWRLGFSATPLDRNDNKSVFAVAVLGEMICEVGTQSLIEMGFISKPTIRLVPLTQHVWGRDPSTWMKSYDELIVRSERRNALVVDIARAAAKPALVFVKIVDHGRQLTRWINETDIPAEFVWGDQPVPTRKAKVAKLMRGDLDVIVTSSVLQTGIDMPAVESVVNGAGMKSTIAALQRMGRGMRTHAGKDGFELWDIYDQGDRFMEEHAKARRRAYKKEGHEVNLGWPTALGPRRR